MLCLSCYLLWIPPPHLCQIQGPGGRYNQRLIYTEIVISEIDVLIRWVSTTSADLVCSWGGDEHMRVAP